EAIVDIQIEVVRERLADRDIDLVVSDAARGHVARVGYDPAYGARPLKRVIQRAIADPIALGLLNGEFREGDTIRVDALGDGLVFEVGAPEPAAAGGAGRPD